MSRQENNGEKFYNEIMSSKAMKMFEKTSGKGNFTYEDKNGLVIMGGLFHFDRVNKYLDRENNNKLEDLYAQYQNIKLDSKGNKNDEYTFKQLIKLSQKLSDDIEKDEEINMRKRIRQYFIDLDDSQLDSYEKQIEKYETLYKEYIK